MKRTNKKNKQKHRKTQRVKGGVWPFSRNAPVASNTGDGTLINPVVAQQEQHSSTGFFNRLFSARVAPSSQIVHATNSLLGVQTAVPIENNDNSKSLAVATPLPVASSKNIPKCIPELNELFNTNENLIKIVEYKKTNDNKLKYELFSINFINQKGENQKVSLIDEKERDTLFDITNNLDLLDFKMKFEMIKKQYQDIKHIVYPPESIVEDFFQSRSGLKYLYKYIQNYCKIFDYYRIYSCKYKNINEELKKLKTTEIDKIINNILKDYKENIEKTPPEYLAKNPDFWVKILNNSFESNYDEDKLTNIINDIETKFDAIYTIYLELQEYNNLPVTEAQVAGKRKRNKSKKS